MTTDRDQPAHPQSNPNSKKTATPGGQNIWRGTPFFRPRHKVSTKLFGTRSEGANQPSTLSTPKYAKKLQSQMRTTLSKITKSEDPKIENRSKTQLLEQIRTWGFRRSIQNAILGISGCPHPPPPSSFLFSFFRILVYANTGPLRGGLGRPGSPKNRADARFLGDPLGGLRPPLAGRCLHTSN